MHVAKSYATKELVMTATKTTTPAKKTAAAKPAKVKSETKRTRLFRLLALKANTSGLTGAQIRAKLDTTGILDMLRDETVAGRLKRMTLEDVRGHVFTLTAKGLKALDKGTVDSEAAPQTKASDWADK